MDTESTLSEFIEIGRHFQRSVNLEKDYNNHSGSDEYVITRTARQILSRISEGLTKDSTYRAWTVTGPYGVGKSAFAVFLTRLLCDEPKARQKAWSQLIRTDPAVVKELSLRGYGSNGSKGMLPVLLTARRASATLCFLEGIQSAISHIEGAQTLAERAELLLKDVEKGAVVDSRAVSLLIELLAEAAQRAGHSGLLVLVDELGKLFEFAARSPQRGDVFVLQEIAEQASRSGPFPILFIGFLHQSFEEYGVHLDSFTRREWAKVHGRFEDVAFLEPAEQVIRMIASAIQWKSLSMPSDLTHKIRHVAKMASECGVCPSGIRDSEFEDVCLQAYPIHPVTLVALPFVFRRFAQNERSLFSYLSSLEPGGFQEFIRTHRISDHEPVFLRLHSLFDYFTINFGAGLFRQPQARRWLEAADVLESKDNLGDSHAQIVKTIGILGALGDFCNLSAREEIISVALIDDSKPSEEIQEALEFLGDQSVLTYRRYNNTYRIWEGSDVDIDERVAEGQRKVRGSISLASNIQRYLEPRPMVARRHAFVTGALRYFNVVYVDDPEQVLKCQEEPISGAAGIVLVCLSSSSAQLDAYRNLAAGVIAAQLGIVIAIPQQMGDINAAITELASLRWAWDNTPELRDDRVARREIALRITESEHILRRSLENLLDPRIEPHGSGCLWYWNGVSQGMCSRVSISHLLSDVCDRRYSATPHIRNELIVRRNLSSAAAAARRNLVERMLTQSEKPLLGMDGYPPERSMYESVLRATGLHSLTEQGDWFFGPPFLESTLNLWPVWQCLVDQIFGSEPVPRPINEIFDLLSSPPYGVMEGLNPVLLCAFILAYPDETTLYREGSFIPESGIAEFEVLMRRPELFAIAGTRVAGARVAVVERLARGLAVKPTTVSVVKALFAMVRRLPEFAWRTSVLPDMTLRMRETFEKAKSPERFLYVDLPTALDLPTFSDDQIETSQVETFFDNLNHNLKDWADSMPKIISQSKETLLRACHVEPTMRGWQQLQDIASKLESRESDPVLSQLFARIVQSGHDEPGICSVLSLVVNRPIANWLDSDVARFSEVAEGLGNGIRRSVLRHGLKDKSHNSMLSLTSYQRERAKLLAAEVAEKVSVLRGANEREVLRAALMLVADEMQRGKEGRDDEQR